MNQQPITQVQCGCCLGKVNLEDATLEKLPKDRGQAYICRGCYKNWREISAFIKPIRFDRAA